MDIPSRESTPRTPAGPRARILDGDERCEFRTSTHGLAAVRPVKGEPWTLLESNFVENHPGPRGVGARLADPVRERSAHFVLPMTRSVGTLRKYPERKSHFTC
jgi:hypothetical protein